MNWTGGNLFRHSRGGVNKGLIQRQKAHFAKARTKLQDGNPVREAAIALQLPQSSSGRFINWPHEFDEPGYDRGSGTYGPNFQNEASSKEPIATAELSNLPSHGTSAQACSPALLKKRDSPSISAPVHNRRDESKHLYNDPSLEIQIRRLLNGEDWLGLAHTKPMHLRFEEGEEKAGLGKRKKLLGKQRSRLQPLSKQYLLRNDGFASESTLRDNELQIKIGSEAFASSSGIPAVPGAYKTGMNSGDPEDSVSAIVQVEGETLHGPRSEEVVMCEQPLRDEEYLDTVPESDQDARYEIRESRAQDGLRMCAEESEEKNSSTFVQDYHGSLAVSSVSSLFEPGTHIRSTKQYVVAESPLLTSMRNLDRIGSRVSKSESRSSSLRDDKNPVPRSRFSSSTADGAGEDSGDQEGLPEDDTQWRCLLGLVPGRQEGHESDLQDKDDSSYQEQNISWPEHARPIPSRSPSAMTSDPLSDCSKAHFDCSTPLMGEPSPGARTDKSLLLAHGGIHSKGDMESLLGVGTGRSALVNNRLKPEDDVDNVWKKFVFGGGVQRSPLENGSGVWNMTARSTSLPAVLRKGAMTVSYDTIGGSSACRRPEHASSSMTFESLPATAGDTDTPSPKWRPGVHRGD